VIEFNETVLGTNEAQRAMADLDKKYQPQQQKIQAAQADIESLRKQVQALPATTTDEERANRLKVIDAKDKQLNLDIENAQNSAGEDQQKAIGPIFNKVGQAAVKYAQDNGFTLLVNSSAQQQGVPSVIWWSQTTDISQAVINAYNASSGIAAPPSAPGAAPKRPTPAAPAAAPKKP
jgi:Skp family chaperone for outer membrane proteins